MTIVVFNWFIMNWFVKKMFRICSFRLIKEILLILILINNNTDFNSLHLNINRDKQNLRYNFEVYKTTSLQNFL